MRSREDSCNLEAQLVIALMAIILALSLLGLVLILLPVESAPSESNELYFRGNIKIEQRGDKLVISLLRGASMSFCESA